MMTDKDDDLFDSVNSMADRLGLKGRERSKYVHDSMTRGGYKAVPQYVRAEDDDDDDDDSNFFSRRSRRDDGSDRARSRRRSRDDDDDWYK